MMGLHMRVLGAMPYRKDIITAAAGPAASFLLAFLSAVVGRYYHHDSAFLLAGVSLIFCLFNLLPVFPLDGGRIVYAAIAALGGPDKADAVTAVTGCTVIFALLVAGTVILLRTRVNFSLLMVAVWLLVGYCQKSADGIESKGNKRKIGCAR
jgi:membrane-associated protease RseP (regulator of RpoE activity)